MIWKSSYCNKERKLKIPVGLIADLLEFVFTTGEPEDGGLVLNEDELGLFEMEIGCVSTSALKLDKLIFRKERMKEIIK